MRLRKKDIRKERKMKKSIPPLDLNVGTDSTKRNEGGEEEEEEEERESEKREMVVPEELVVVKIEELCCEEMSSIHRACFGGVSRSLQNSLELICEPSLLSSFSSVWNCFFFFFFEIWFFLEKIIQYKLK